MDRGLSVDQVSFRRAYRTAKQREYRAAAAAARRLTADAIDRAVVEAVSSLARDDDETFRRVVERAASAFARLPDAEARIAERLRGLERRIVAPSMLDHFRVDGPAVVSFSGGRSSAFMLRTMLDAYGGTLPDSVAVCFANTGLEHAETLEFVRRCGKEWDVAIHWLEYDPEAPNRTRVVDHQSASRHGEPFTALNGKRSYLPNVVSRYCTVELKVRRIKMFARHVLGLSRWYSVVGLRADEPRRVERQQRRAAERRDEGIPVMPMAGAGIMKADVARFWAANAFDLALPSVDGTTPLGNCVGCYLKGKRKLTDIFQKYPEAADWWINQERRFPSTVRPGDYCRFSARWTYAELRVRAIASAKEEMENDEADLESVDCACTD